MPVSSPFGKPELSSWLIEHVGSGANRYVLDVGPGQAMLSTRLRKAGALGNAIWVGLEIWAPYIRKFGLARLYAAVMVGDVRFYRWETFPNYLVTFLGDVLEHMPADDAIQVVAAARAHSDYVVCCFPTSPVKSADNENPFDDHVVDCYALAMAIGMFGEPVWQYDEHGAGILILEGTR